MSASASYVDTNFADKADVGESKGQNCGVVEADGGGQDDIKRQAGGGTQCQPMHEVCGLELIVVCGRRNRCVKRRKRPYSGEHYTVRSWGRRDEREKGERNAVLPTSFLS